MTPRFRTSERNLLLCLAFEDLWMFVASLMSQEGERRGGSREGLCGKYWLFDIGKVLRLVQEKSLKRLFHRQSGAYQKEIDKGCTRKLFGHDSQVRP